MKILMTYKIMNYNNKCKLMIEYLNKIKMILIIIKLINNWIKIIMILKHL